MLWQKLLGGTAGAPKEIISFSGAPASYYVSRFAYLVLRNVNQTTPLDVTPTIFVNTSNGVADPPAITTVSGSTLIVAVAANSSTDAFKATAFNPPYSTYSIAQRTEGNIAESQIGIGAYRLSSAGTTDPPSFGGGTAPNAALAVTIALRRTTTNIQVIASGVETNPITATPQNFIVGDLQPGDFIVAALAFRGSNSDIQCTSDGYTELSDLFASGTRSSANLGIYYKFVS